MYIMIDLWNSHKAKDKTIQSNWRLNLHEFIFEADTKAGKTFDILLIVFILLSVLVVILDSVSEIRLNYGEYLYVLEWIFTILFTVEYVLRIISIGRPLKYITSFFGIIDLMAILPTYISLFVPGAQTLIIIRILRVLRIFRVLKLVQYLGEARALARALKDSRKKIVVFLATVLVLVIIFGSVMYLVEGEEGGFINIPKSIYWAVVTLTTVGYGDITPQSDLGKIISSLLMLLGYSLLVVPTGIITAELTHASLKKVTTQSCPTCSHDIHDPDANFCKSCGSKL